MLPADPTTEEIRKFLAERRLRRHAWDVFERGTRRAAMRAIRRTPDDDTPEADRPERTP